MTFNTHALNWFEIPVSDFDRAKKFYESIFDYQMPENQMGPARMGFLLYDFQNGGRGGAIVHNPGLTVVLEKVIGAGGKILQEKKPVGPNLGYWALIEDSEANRVALHSMN